jgi:hypothetical protein
MGRLQSIRMHRLALDVWRLDCDFQAIKPQRTQCAIHASNNVNGGGKDTKGPAIKVLRVLSLRSPSQSSTPNRQHLDHRPVAF